MKIALFSTPRGWGGGENLLAQLADGLRACGVEPLVAAPEDSAVARWATDQSVTLLPLPGRARGPRAMWRLRSAIARGGVDLIVLNDPHAITYGGAALAGLGVPRVGVKHTCFPLRSAWKHNHLLESLVCVAEAARVDCLQAGVQAERMQVIHAGLEHTPPTDEQVAAAEALFAQGSDPGDRHVLAIGSLLPVKGFDTTIDSVARGVAAGQPWRLWIAGEGPERPALEKQIRDAGLGDRATLLGFRTDTAALLAAADAFVSASHREGLSLVLVEAMLAGTPVVATPVGGNGEALLINEPGESTVARAVAPGDPAAMAGAIEAALANTPANSARLEEAKRWASDHFTVERMTADYVALFERLIAQQAERRRAA